MIVEKTGKNGSKKRISIEYMQQQHQLIRKWIPGPSGNIPGYEWRED